MGPRTTTLKESPARTVTLVEEETGPPRVVKRFHHPHPLQGLRDRFRARAEFRLLDHLWRRGVRVPRPLEVTAAGSGTPGGWEVAMEWVPGAGPLEPLLDAPAAATARGVSWEGLTAALGRLLAGLHAAGVDHADLHVGNVVVAADGTPFLVDFDKARLRRRLPAGLPFRDLLAATAAARETLSPRLRSRFLAAWHRALPMDVARAVGPPHELGAEVEAAARGARRAALERGAGRWLRDSSLCSVERAAGRLVVRRRNASAEEAAGDPTPPPGHWVDAGPAGEVTARWRNAARLIEHHLPAAEPRILVREGTRARATYRVGPGAPESTVAPAVGGRLLGLLHDRGLDPPRLRRVWTRPDGTALLLPPDRLDPLEPAAELDDERRFRALGAPPAAEARAAYRRALAAAFETAGWPPPRPCSSADVSTSARTV